MQAFMGENHERAISLTFSQAVSVLMEACDVDLAGRAAFEARVKQLQRLGVRKRSTDAPPRRPYYGIAELAAFATAVRLMAAFMVPTLAARYVVERWSELAPFALVGAKEALPADYLARRPLRGGPIAIFEGNALADLGQKGRHEERYVGALGRITIVGEDGGELSSATGGTGLFLDSRTYMPALITQFMSLSMATDADLAAELDRLRFGF